MPMQDASDIMYDRLPVSNFYETFKNDGKERYLKSKVNPSKSNKVEDDGHFVSDDAPITLFMDYLVKSVINYNEWFIWLLIISITMLEPQLDLTFPSFAASPTHSPQKNTTPPNSGLPLSGSVTKITIEIPDSLV